MRLGSILTVMAAAVLAVLAGVMAQSWLESQRQGEPTVAAAPQEPLSKIVVAAEPLRFGAELTAANLKEIPWASSTLPPGAFASAAELLSSSDKRVVISAIEADEPVLKWKITGPGQRAALSALIDGDHKAVTIRVDDVFGVAGFVMPGDRVDVLLTRTETGASDQKQFTDVLLQHVRVLGIDQIADDRTDKASVVKAVTLEVDTGDAQKLALSRSVGNLSLALCRAGAMNLASTQRVTADELGTPRQVTAQASEPSNVGHVGVMRGLKETAAYTVPSETIVPGPNVGVRKTADAENPVDQVGRATGN